MFDKKKIAEMRTIDTRNTVQAGDVYWLSPEYVQQWSKTGEKRRKWVAITDNIDYPSTFVSSQRILMCPITSNPRCAYSIPFVSNGKVSFISAHCPQSVPVSDIVKGARTEEISYKVMAFVRYYYGRGVCLEADPEMEEFIGAYKNEIAELLRKGIVTPYRECELDRFISEITDDELLVPVINNDALTYVSKYSDAAISAAKKTLKPATEEKVVPVVHSQKKEEESFSNKPFQGLATLVDEAKNRKINRPINLSNSNEAKPKKPNKQQWKCKRVQRYPQLTTSDKADLISDAIKSKTYAELAKYHGVTACTIGKWLKAAESDLISLGVELPTDIVKLHEGTRCNRIK